MEEDVKLLCVDDEKNVLKALRRIFMDDDYDINTAESGEEGLGILEENQDTQIVISDYRMPGMNGVEFLKHVRERWPETIRIVLSGYADTASVVAAINEGHIYKFVPKPWDDEEIRSVVTGALETYNLQKANRVLTKKLQDSNVELQLLNDKLEQIVEERTGELFFQNKVLQRGQYILDTLPIGVLGFDTESMIVQCNKMAANLLFGEGSVAPVGMEGESVLPGDLLSLVTLLKEKGKILAFVEVNGRVIYIKGETLCDSAGTTGMVLVLDDEERQ